MVLNLILALSLWLMPMQGVAFTEEQLAPLKTRLAALLTQGQGVGVGVALAEGNATNAFGIGLAATAQQRPVTEATLFAVASVTKIVVAIAFLDLLEREKIPLDSLLHELAPDLAPINPWAATHPVRLVHLLEHTTGLQEIIVGESLALAGKDTYVPASRLVELGHKRAHVRWPPGTASTYSNFNYLIVAALIERLSGRVFDDYIHTTIFAPLNMQDSGFRLADTDASRLAYGYRAGKGPPISPMEGFYRPSAGMISSPRDLAILLGALVNDGSANGVRIASPAVLNTMEHAHDSVAVRHGLALGQAAGVTRRQVAGRILYGHNGITDGFMASLFYSRDLDIGFAFLLNAHAIPTSPSLSQLRDAVLELAFPGTGRAPPPEVSVEAAELASLAGFYAFENPRFAPLPRLQALPKHAWVFLKNNTLYMRTLFDKETALVAFGNGRFGKRGEIEPRLVFGREPDNRSFMYEVPNSLYYRDQPFVHVAWLFGLAFSLATTVLFIASLVPSPRQGQFRLERRASLATAACLGAMVLALLTLDDAKTATALNPATAVLFVASALFPAMAMCAWSFTVLRMIRRRCVAPWWLVGTTALLGLSVLFVLEGIAGIRPWLVM